MNDQKRLPGLDRETATEILSNLAADAARDEREEEWTDSDPNSEKAIGAAPAKLIKDKEDPPRSVPLTEGEKLGSDEALDTFPVGFSHFYADLGRADRLAHLFATIADTLAAGRNVQLRVPISLNLRSNAFYVTVTAGT